MKLLGLLQRVMQRRAKSALTPDGVALGHGIEQLQIVPGAARRIAELQACIAAASMTDLQREAHVQVFGTSSEKELMASLCKQRRDD